MEQMQEFTTGLKAQTRILLDALIGGTIKINIEDEVKKLSERFEN